MSGPGGSRGGAAGPSAPAVGLEQLLSAATSEERVQAALALTAPSTDEQRFFAGALALHGEAFEAAFERMAAAAAMPPGAELRWGPKVATHRCAVRDGNCFALLAQADEGEAALDRLAAHSASGWQHVISARGAIPGAASAAPPGSPRGLAGRPLARAGGRPDKLYGELEVPEVRSPPPRP